MTHLSKVRPSPSYPPRRAARIALRYDRQAEVVALIMTIEVSWWLWVLLGIALLAGEILTPGGFYLCFFGAAALVVGALNLSGFSAGLAREGLIFVALAVAGMLFFRRPLLERYRRLAPEIEVDKLTSEVASALEEIAAGAIGKAELRGTTWNARNVGDIPIPKAARCRVLRVDGLTLDVRGL